MSKHDRLSNNIVDTALEIADRNSWSSLSLGEIADQIKVPLVDVYACYTDLDDVASAWIRRADIAMVEAGSVALINELPIEERLHTAIMGWLTALEGRRSIMGEILFYKLKPPHFHLQAQFVIATSQRIQMLRDVVHLRASGLTKSTEEIGLTILFASTVLVWLNDSSDNLQQTSSFLKKRLQLGSTIMSKIKKVRITDPGIQV